MASPPPNQSIRASYPSVPARAYCCTRGAAGRASWGERWQTGLNRRLRGA